MTRLRVDIDGEMTAWKMRSLLVSAGVRECAIRSVEVADD